jgi:hypothetical protein
VHEVIVLYDLSDPDAWEAARRHRAYWGRLYTDVFSLDLDRIVLVFRPAPDEDWRGFERIRLQWIFEELESEAGAA